MWCPKCKNEYIDGITTCKDCQIPLVEELTPENTAEYDRTASAPFPVSDSSEEDGETAPKVKVYVKKDAAYEDVKSTASTFLIIGTLGILALFLVAFDVIPLSMETYMKILMLLVMGTLFIIFLIIGVVYQHRLTSLRTEVQEEEDTSRMISDWFFEQFTAEAIDSRIPELPKEDEALYFARYEIMEAALKAKFPELSESYADHMLEEFYGKLFEAR